MKSVDFVLLVTGCISPNKQQSFLQISSPKIRYKQYMESLRFYIECTNIKKIVFCENSNFSMRKYDTIMDLARRENKELECLSFQGDYKSVEEKGKGYGEGEIIEYALNHSKLLEQAVSFAKVTGRLKIKNINKIIEKISLENNYFNADLYSRRGIDTRFYYCQKQFYMRNLQNLYKRCGMDVLFGYETIETLFFGALIKSDEITNLPLYPVFIGISAGNGNIYTEKLSLKLKIADLLCRINIYNTFYQLLMVFLNE